MRTKQGTDFVSLLYAKQVLAPRTYTLDSYNLVTECVVHKARPTFAGYGLGVADPPIQGNRTLAIKSGCEEPKSRIS